MRVAWRESALRDLEGAIAYIAEHDRGAASEQLRRIEHFTRILADHPHAGRRGRIDGTRELVVPRTPFIIIYTVAEAVELLRVLHGAQQWPPPPTM